MLPASATHASIATAIAFGSRRGEGRTTVPRHRKCSRMSSLTRQACKKSCRNAYANPVWPRQLTIVSEPHECRSRSQASSAAMSSSPHLGVDEVVAFLSGEVEDRSVGKSLQPTGGSRDRRRQSSTHPARTVSGSSHRGRSGSTNCPDASWPPRCRKRSSMTSLRTGAV